MITPKQLQAIYEFGDLEYGKFNYDITICADDTVIFETRHPGSWIPRRCHPAEAGLIQLSNLLEDIGTRDVLLENLVETHDFEINPNHPHLVKKAYDDFEVCYKANKQGLYDFFAMMRRKD